MAANQLAMIYDWKMNTQYRLPRFPNNHVVTYPASAASALLPLTIANNWTPEGEHALSSGLTYRLLISRVSYSRLLWRNNCESQAQPLETILKDSRFETVQSNGSQHGWNQRWVEDRDDAGEGENDGRFHHDSRWKARTREWWVARNRYASLLLFLSLLSLTNRLDTIRELQLVMGTSKTRSELRTLEVQFSRLFCTILMVKAASGSPQRAFSRRVSSVSIIQQREFTS